MASVLMVRGSAIGVRKEKAICVGGEDRHVIDMSTIVAPSHRGYLRGMASSPRQEDKSRTSGKGPGKPSQLPRISWFWFISLLLLNIWFARSFFSGTGDAPVSVPYTLFKAEVERGNVEEVYGKGESISGTFITPV
jgi:hypothetical protein